jgi:glyoxylate reductase
VVNVLVTGNLPGDIADRIRDGYAVRMHDLDRPMQRDALLEAVAHADGLLCMITDRVDEKLLDLAPRLKIVANFGVGYNNIDVDAAAGRGVMVTNTPDVLTDSTADLAMALLLAVGRRMVESDRYTREGRFGFWAPFHFLGHEVSGATLGILGMGRIGEAVARRARGFNMRVLYHNRTPLPPDREQALGAGWVERERLLETSDYVSLHVPLTPDTHHLIGEAELAMMKPDAFLINTSRGPVVDEAALLKALKDGRIAGAGLDVYENEPVLTPGLPALDNVVLLPHIGSATMTTRRRMATMAVDNLLAGLEGEAPLNWVNKEMMARRTT